MNNLAENIEVQRTTSSAQDLSCVVCGTKQSHRFDTRGYSYFGCPTCGLVSTYPFPEGDVIEAHYANKFETGNYKLVREYSEKLRRGPFTGFANFLEARLKELGRNLKGREILDIGCFTGDFLSVLKERGAEVYGVELQDQAVEIALREFPGRIFKADVFSNDFPSKQFDVVAGMGVIEHVREPGRLMQRMFELLKPGGILLLQTPDSGSLVARMFGKFWPPYAPVEHIHLFSHQALNQELSQIGFDRIAIHAHWKALPIDYVFQQFKNFGPEFQRLLAPIFKLMPKFITQRSLPFYCGEMLVSAHKPE